MALKYLYKVKLLFFIILLFALTILIVNKLNICLCRHNLKETSVKIKNNLQNTTKKVNYFQNTSIPNEIIVTKIIHQSWKTHTLPSRFRQWSNTWKTCFPGWTYKLWSNEENRKLIETDYPWFLKTYDSLPSDITRADAARYIYLFHEGGIYTDLDNECMKPFENLLEGHELVFGAMLGQYGSFIKEGYTQNSFMYSTPKQLFWLEILFGIMTYTGNKNVPEAQTGPIRLVNAINSYRVHHSDAIKIYPPKYFNPFSWLKKKETSIESCKAHNEMTDYDLATCRAFYNESYVVQYHSHSWGRHKSLD